MRDEPGLLTTEIDPGGRTEPEGLGPLAIEGAPTLRPAL
jgi:hypothetical protein